MNVYLACNQTLDFCSINMHFQNGIAELNIRYLQVSIQSILLDTIRLWPEMILLELWPLALLKATRLANCTCFDRDGRAPIAHFSKSNAILTVKEEHIFGCPIFVLDNTLQRG